MTGHTESPWRVKPSKTLGCRIIQGPKCGTHRQAQHDELAWTAGLANDDRDKANADLMAAAPELLEALKLATDEINAIRARDGHPVSYQFGPNGPIRIDLCTDEWWDELTEKCFAVIAKAQESAA